MAQLGTVLGPFLWLFYGWFVGCFMAQLGTILGPFVVVLWLVYGLFYGSIRDCFGTLFMAGLWAVI